MGKTSFSAEYAAGEERIKDIFVVGGETNAEGEFSISVPAGSYFVKTFVEPGRKFLGAEEQAVALKEAETKTLTLQLRIAERKITGKVLAEEKAVADAFVWGWSNKGGYQETSSKSDGSFELNVTPQDTWRVAGSKTIGGEFSRSDEVSVAVGTSTDPVQDIALKRIAAVPRAVTRSADSTKPTVIEVPQGPTVMVPANAVSTSGNMSINVQADARAPSQGEVKVVGTAYDFEARDAAGKIVTSFNTAVTMTISYDEAELVRLGIKEEELKMSFWDKTTGTWKILANSVVNTKDNVVMVTVDHFTRFAIVAAADIIPPTAPTDINAAALGQGKIKLTWKNPEKDFRHAKVYRSEKEETLGAVRAAEVKGVEFTDEEGLADGVRYYYAIRAVDPAGNESTNTAQVAVSAKGTSGAKKIVAAPTPLPLPTTGTPQIIGIKGQLTKNLRRGVVGEEVKTLQEFLLKSGFYPEGLITGYFGTLTEKAAIRFQEKYADEVLKPVELSKGSGFVGSLTRKKINQLMGR